MNKKYSVIDDKILRGQDVIATIEGDSLDFLDGMAKYRIHAVKAFNAYKGKQAPTKKEPNLPSKNTEPTEAPTKPKKEILKNTAKGWREVVSEIIGQELPEPDKENGYRKSKLRAILLKHYREICASKELTPKTKQNITKLFI
jgi:hypothetical protein